MLKFRAVHFDEVSVTVTKKFRKYSPGLRLADTTRPKKRQRCNRRMPMRLSPCRRIKRTDYRIDRIRLVDDTVR